MRPAVGTLSNTGTPGGSGASHSLRPLRADDTISSGPPVVAESHQVTENFHSSTNHFDCVGAPPFHRGIGQVLIMLTAIMGIVIVLSIGILVAHALDSFR